MDDSREGKDDKLCSKSSSQVDTSSNDKQVILKYGYVIRNATEGDFNEFKNFLGSVEFCKANKLEDRFIEFIIASLDLKGTHYNDIFEGFKTRKISPDVLVKYCNEYEKYFRARHYTSNIAFLCFKTQVEELHKRLCRNILSQVVLVQNKNKMNNALEQSKADMNKSFDERLKRDNLEIQEQIEKVVAEEHVNGSIDTLDKNQFMINRNEFLTSLKTQYDLIGIGCENMFKTCDQMLLNPTMGAGPIMQNGIKLMQFCNQSLLQMSQFTLGAFKQVNIANFINCIQQNQIISLNKQLSESLARDLNTNAAVIEAKNETIETQKESIEMQKQSIAEQKAEIEKLEQENAQQQQELEALKKDLQNKDIKLEMHINALNKVRQELNKQTHEQLCSANKALDISNNKGKQNE